MTSCQDSENPIAVALRFVECINRQNLEGLVNLMPADHTFIDLAGDVRRGKETMEPGWNEYFSMCPEYMIHVSELYLVEDEVIIVGRTTGSHVGDPRHVEIRDTVIWVAKIDEDKVSEWRLYLDTEQNRDMLGATLETRITR